MNFGKLIVLTDVDENVNELLEDAAGRVGMKKHAYIKQALERLAEEEYAIQQVESARSES